MNRLSLIFAVFISLLSASSHAERLIPSSTNTTENYCRLDLYHLIQNEQNQIISNLQLAAIKDKQFNQRFIAIKADIDHPSGFENIGYYRSGEPVEVFTANWRKNGNSHSVSRLVMLGGTSDKQAFDVFTQLMLQDQGFFELRFVNEHYQWIANNRDIQSFSECLSQFDTSSTFIQ